MKTETIIQSHGQSAASGNDRLSLHVSRFTFHALRFALLLSFLFLAAHVHAQSYSIDWSTIDGGGGNSTGGVFSVTGTIGQPDAGRMGGGSYTLDGGFWSIIAAVQLPGAPLLRIQLLTVNSVLVAWPVSATGFALQENSTLDNNWVSVTNAINVSGDENQIQVSPLIGNKLFRLTHP